MAFLAKLSCLSAVAICLSSCEAGVTPKTNPCEIRSYHQQDFLAFSNNNPRAVALPALGSNSYHFQPYITEGLWLIKGHVRVDSWPRFFSEKTSLYEEISPETTFLVVGVDDPSSYEFESERYFDAGYSDLGLSENCPILVGQRNGQYALAAIRKSGGRETAELRARCNAFATLTFLGIPPDGLKDYSAFAIQDVIGLRYDLKAVELYLDKTKTCEG